MSDLRKAISDLDLSSNLPVYDISKKKIIIFSWENLECSVRIDTSACRVSHYAIIKPLKICLFSGKVKEIVSFYLSFLSAAPHGNLLSPEVK